MTCAFSANVGCIGELQMQSVCASLFAPGLAFTENYRHKPYFH